MSEFETVRTLTPGKIILSGEHAVIYGTPALAMAVNRFLQVDASRAAPPNQITIELPQFETKYSFALTEIMDLYAALNEKYQSYLAERLPIHHVIAHPIELIVYCVASVLCHPLCTMSTITLSPGLHLHINSNIPLGCGMGSSAACIMGILTALCQLFNIEMPPQTRYQLAHHIESLQHGKSSGIDVSLALQGGAIKFQAGQSHRLPLPQFNFILIHSGEPKSSTGESVSYTKPYFSREQNLRAFAKVAEKFEHALLSNDQKAINQCIQQNHHLLSNAGVVSFKVRQFINSLFKMGSAGKICGAGSVEGDACGMLLVTYDIRNRKQLSAINDLTADYGYSAMHVQGCEIGVTIQKDL